MGRVENGFCAKPGLPLILSAAGSARGRLGAWMLALLLLCACASPPPPIPMTADRAFAWTAESPERGSGLIVLVGSLHVGRAPIELGPELTGAFARSDSLVLEIDSEALGLIEAVGLINRYARLPSNESLSDRISPELYRDLETWSERFDQSMSAFDSFEPWLAATVVGLKEWEDRGFLPKYGSEAQFTALAHQQDKSIEELETPGEQMSALSSLSREMQQEMLGQALLAGDSSYADLIELWRSGDDVALSEFLVAEMVSPNNELFEKLIRVRNQRMTQRLIERASDGQSRFVLVGVGHLVGESSIPDLLKARGYRIHRIRSLEP